MPPDEPVDSRYIPARHAVAKTARTAVQIFVKSTTAAQCRVSEAEVEQIPATGSRERPDAP